MLRRGEVAHLGPHSHPTGERIRSKVELTRFLGPDCDLTCFDFKRGVLQHLPTKAPSSQKKKKRVWPRKAVPSIKEEQPPEPQLGSPAPQHPLAIWCENCGANILGDSAGRQRLRSLCKTCRAQRNAFNREQRTFKRVGCGDCAACQMTEDCGICTACVVQLPQPGTPRLPQSQCAQRRCLKIINKSFSCGLCSGCQTKEDCGACRICERKGKPGLKRHWKCLQRRCLKKRIMKRPRGLAAQKIPGRWPAQVVGPSGTAKDRPPSKLPRSQVRCLMRLPTVVTRNIGCKTKEPKWGQGSPAPSKLRYSSRRQSRRCGACAACQRCVDCGQCDFCQDKPKFGGCNQKRQKCRWRQCLHFAMKRLLPTARWDSPAVEGAALPRYRSRRRKGALVKQAKSGGLQGQRLVTEALSSGLEQKGLPVLTEELGPGFMLPPETDLVILQEQEGGEGIPVLRAPACILLQEYECPGLGVFIASPSVKQEVESYGDQTPGAASPLPAGFSSGLCNKGANRGQLQNPVKQEESFGNGEEEEEAAKATTPVIMEIYSLSGATPTPVGPYVGLDSVLQEFLAELNELPLPAHWEVLPPRGPDLCIIQRSPLSTMAAAVIHIQPGLYFHVVVQDVPVPPSHELYLAHPLRLTTVDEVVELICNLEAYHLCPGWPGRWEQGSRSPDCDVLVYEGRCQACCLEPYPSGSSSN
ncbi:methyl-CpG-binding domain protein 1-like isoform X3 [Trichosurus vulpecula]|uniref:methyl-CpG-binding domain protein 1-like isoform X3 n=1 Tax=Trichosurus vulpecula TaxID=9337 RepID=UPI00186B4307|nr:methyl-CpG-binding domain protein 1-like isoform X3 [Trichosurus vulpecula]